MATRPVFSLDARLENADWAKQTWDLPAKNLKELRAYLKERGTTPEQFRKLPVYRFNVDKLPWLKKL